MRRRDVGVLAVTGMAGAAVAQTSGGFQGSGLVGQLEGPTILRDAPRPAQLKEAPMLAELVRAGRLPPVEQRLPQDVMVIQPLREIGKYGGTWRRGFIGPGDGENGNRIMSADKPLFFDASGTELMPCLCKAWEVSADGRRTTLHLRRGLRWSDGSPHTADDWMFWFNDLYSNRDLVPAPAPELASNGKPGRMVKVDDATIAFEFDEPYFLFPQLLAGDTLVGGGGNDLFELTGDDIAYASHADGVKAMLSVRENLTFWASCFGQHNVEAAMDALNLTDLADRLAGNLSAGQKRRLGLARLMVTGRKIWLMDEPTVSLDAASVGLFGAMLRLHLAQGGAAIVATHIDLGLPEAQVLDLSPFKATSLHQGAFDEAFA